MRLARLCSLAFALGLAVGCAHTPGTYASPYRQAVYDGAMRSKSCRETCCKMPGGEFNEPGVWSEGSHTCTWHASYLQLDSCDSWCQRETGLDH